MTNPKIPTPIVDKNGKKTTVHRSVEKQGKPTRGIPVPTQGTKSPVERVARALKKTVPVTDRLKFGRVIHALTGVNSTTARDRYDALVSTVANTYGIDKLRAKKTADNIYIALGLSEGIKETSHSEALHAASSKVLMANFKTRFPAATEGITQPRNVVATLVHDTADRAEDEVKIQKILADRKDSGTIGTPLPSVHEMTDEQKEQQRIDTRELLAEIAADEEAEKTARKALSTKLVADVNETIADEPFHIIAATELMASLSTMRVDTSLKAINELLANRDKPSLVALNEVLSEHDINIDPILTHALFYVGGRTGNAEETREAFRMVLTDFEDVDSDLIAAEFSKKTNYDA